MFQFHSELNQIGHSPPKVLPEGGTNFSAMFNVIQIALLNPVVLLGLVYSLMNVDRD